MTLFLVHLPQLLLNGKVYRAMPPLYKIKHSKKTIYLQTKDELDNYIKKHGQPKEITRFKGIGEMSPDELWETTLNPQTRKLSQITVKDIEETLKLFKILMSSNSSSRKDFILENLEGVVDYE